MADPAVVVGCLVSFVIERNKIHLAPFSAGCWEFGSGFEQNNVRLISFHPGDIRSFFNQLLFDTVVAPCAGQRGIDLSFDRRIEMAVDAAKMRRLTHGDPVVFCFLLMAITTATFFSLVIEQFFFGFVVRMMAFFAFIISTLGMCKVE